MTEEGSEPGSPPASVPKDPDDPQRSRAYRPWTTPAALAGAGLLLLSAAALVVSWSALSEIVDLRGEVSRNQEELVERFDELYAKPPGWEPLTVPAPPPPSASEFDGYVVSGGYSVLVEDPVLQESVREAVRAAEQPRELPGEDVTGPQVDIPEIVYGETVARLRIPKIGADYVVTVGTDEEALKKGPGLWKYGAVPGAPGNATVAGHRTTHGAPFRHVDQLVPGDVIEVEVPGIGLSIYEVRGTMIVDPTATGVTAQGPGVRLTLTTCHPVGSAKERMVVQAELVSGPFAEMAVPIEEWEFRTEFDTGG